MAQSITASELILESPDGTKKVRIHLEDDGYLYYEDIATGEAQNITRVVETNYSEPQHN